MMQESKQELLPKPKDMMGMRVEYQGIFFPPIVSPHSLEKVKTFEVREDDIVLATYPKCGTHWMMEVLGLLQVDGHVEQVQRPTDKRAVGCIEFVIPPQMKEAIADVIDDAPSPRFYVTHLPAQMLPSQIWTKKPKMIYVTRNPKDAATSSFNFLNCAAKDPSDAIKWEDFFNLFTSENALFGNWFDHTLGYWNHRDDKNVLFVRFEEMKKDIRSVTNRLASFLEVTITPEGMERIVEHSSLAGMKKTYAKLEKEHEFGELLTKASGRMPFLQKGTVGGWKSHFTVAQSEKMDETLKERLRGTGLEVHYN